MKLLIKKTAIFRNMNMRNKLLIIFIMIGLVPVLFFAAFFFQQSKSAFEEELGKYTLEISKQVGGRLDAFVQEMERVSNIIRFNSDVQTILYEWTEERTASSIYAERNVRSLFENIGNFREDFKGIFMVTDHGLLVYNGTGDVAKLHYNFHDDPWYQSVKEQTHFRLNKAHPQTYVKGEEVVTFSARITDNREFKTKGTLLIDFSPQTIKSMSENIQLGSSGHVWMMTAEGEPILPSQTLPDWLKDEELFKKVQQESSGFIPFDYAGVQMLAGFYTSSETGWKIIGSVPFEELASGLYGIRTFIVILAIAALVVILLLATALSRMITKPLKVMEHRMAEVGKGNFETGLPVMARDEIGRLSISFNRMITELHRMNNEVFQSQLREYRQQIQLQNSEMRALQAQINPHFLYNTLNTIACIAEVYDREEISEVSHSLSRMLQYSITGGSTATVEEELTHLLSYMSIVNVRFPMKFTLELQADPEIRRMSFMKLIFQPLVENAVNHGFPGLDQGHIRVEAKMDGDAVIFTFADDGIGIAKERLNQIRAELRQKEGEGGAASDHIGLRNVYYRLNMLYGDRFSMTIWSKPGEGTRIVIRIEGGAADVTDIDRG